MHFSDVHVEEVPLSERLRAELAEVEVGAREVDVLHVFFGGAGVAEALLAHGAAVPARRASRAVNFFCCVTDPDEFLFHQRQISESSSMLKNEILAGSSVLATYVARFVILRDVWIRTQRATVASRCANNLATHIPN